MKTTNLQTVECRICDFRGKMPSLAAREMMFGSNEEFTYAECPKCGCLQIVEIPVNLSNYYPADYYSYQKPSRLKTLVKGAWLSQRFDISVAISRVLSLVPGINIAPRWIRMLNLSKTASILDFGCGSGEKLFDLRAAGYRNLVGADPYLPAEIDYGNGIKLLKKDLSEIEATFDCVSMHHSFEHMANQHQTLTQIRNKLAPNGVLLVRVPLASSLAFDQHGSNWVQLDPPRHLYLHTANSLTQLALKNGFVLEKQLYDSTAFQFWGSEQYAKGIPLVSECSYAVNRRRSGFSRRKMRNYSQMAHNVNKSRKGDQAAFYFRVQ